MAQTEPLISVVIPTRTAEYKLIPTLESLINQTYKNLEILVIDDHGANATKSIVEEFTKRDSRVQYHLNPKQDVRRTNWRGYDINAGYSARDYGFLIAKGGWITTHDATDTSLLNRIEVQFDFAQRYNASMVTVQWMMQKPENIGKKLDVDRLIRERGEKNIVIRAEEITALADKTRGPLMRYWWHKYIPFSIKWFPYTRPLFFRSLESYPGADNSMMFRKEILAVARFRSRNERTWGVPSGRGSGRDFAFQVADIFKNSYSLKLPMYLWAVKSENEEYPTANYNPYLQ